MLNGIRHVDAGNVPDYYKSSFTHIQSRFGFVLRFTPCTAESTGYTGAKFLVCTHILGH